MALAAKRRTPMLLPRGAAGSFALLGLMILGGYFGITALYERVNPSSERILASLSIAAFRQPLPPALADMRASVRTGTEDNFVHIDLDTPVDPEGFQGSEARISYLVFDRAAVASRHFEEHLEGARFQGESEHPRVRARFDVLPIAERNYCFGYGERLHYCQVLVGPVSIDITSYLEMAGISDDPYFPQLTSAALAHLRSTVPGID